VALAPAPRRRDAFLLTSMMGGEAAQLRWGLAGLQLGSVFGTHACPGTRVPARSSHSPRVCVRGPSSGSDKTRRLEDRRSVLK